MPEEQNNPGNNPAGANASAANQGAQSGTPPADDPSKQNPEGATPPVEGAETVEELKKQLEASNKKNAEYEASMRKIQSEKDKQIASYETQVKQYQTIIDSQDSSAEEKLEAKEKQLKMREDILELRQQTFQQAASTDFIGDTLKDLGVPLEGETGKLLKNVLADGDKEDIDNAKNFLGSLVKALNSDKGTPKKEDPNTPPATPPANINTGQGGATPPENQQGQVTVNRSALSDPNATPEEKKAARDAMKGVFGNLKLDKDS